MQSLKLKDKPLVFDNTTSTVNYIAIMITAIVIIIMPTAATYIWE